MHAIYSSLGPQGGIGSHECMLFTSPCPPRDGSDRQGSYECMLFTTLFAIREVSAAKATNACRGAQGSPGKGSDECMIFIALWILREVSAGKEATNACYLQHVGSSGRYRKPRMHAIYKMLSARDGSDR
jgi:hypothetical protein